MSNLRLKGTALWRRFGPQSATSYLTAVAAQILPSPLGHFSLRANKWVGVPSRSGGHREDFMKKSVAGVGLALSLFVLCSPVSIARSRNPGPPCMGYGCPGSASAKSSEPNPSKHRKSKRDRNAQSSAEQVSAASSTVSR
jgi:hypothetical protein